VLKKLSSRWWGRMTCILFATGSAHLGFFSPLALLSGKRLPSVGEFFPRRLQRSLELIPWRRGYSSRQTLAKDLEVQKQKAQEAAEALNLALKDTATRSAWDAVSASWASWSALGQYEQVRIKTSPP
jgi:hypothetical protein